MTGYQLSVDFGTSNTVAVLRWPDGRARPLLFDGAPLLPSAVYADPGGRLLVGRDAIHAARMDPTRFEPNPKRRVDELEVLLGERVFSVVDLFSAVLRQVALEAQRTAGQPLSAVTLTCPVAWGPARRVLLTDAATAAGLRTASLVVEPVAAAAYFATSGGQDIRPGQCVVVYDLGAGTFDASVVRRTATGFDTLAFRGLDDFGGVDLDALVVSCLGNVLGASPQWGRLTHPTTPGDRRQFRQMWDDARTVKESLSRHASSSLHVPIVDTDVHVTREEFEQAARPLLARTVDVTLATLREARIRPDELAGLFLVGGCTRIPLVATMLHQATGITPIVLEQPEIVVAEGAFYASADAAELGSTSGPAFPVSGAGPAFSGSGVGPAFPVSAAPAPVSGVPMPFRAAAAPVAGAQVPFTPAQASVAAGSMPLSTGPALFEAAAMPVSPPAGLAAADSLRTASARFAAPELTLDFATPSTVEHAPNGDESSRRPSRRTWAITAAVVALLIIAVSTVVAFATRDNGRHGVSAAGPSATTSTTGASAEASGANASAAPSAGASASVAATRKSDPRTATLLGKVTSPVQVESVALSADGRKLATGADNGSIRLWDTSTRAQLGPTMTGHTGRVMSMEFSPDGSTLASASADATIRLWNASTSTAQGAPFTGHVDTVWSVAFSPNGQTLVSGGSDRTVRVWSVSSHNQLGSAMTGHSDWVHGVAFSPDGSTVASAAYDKSVRLWNASNQTPIATLSGHTDKAYTVAFSPDGSTLASGSQDKTVRLWSVAGRSAITALQGHTQWVFAVAFNPTGSTVGSCGFDGNLRVWDVPARQAVNPPLASSGFAANTPGGFSRDFTTFAGVGAYPGQEAVVSLWRIS